MSTIDISNLPKHEVLAALHNATRAIGMGVLQDAGPITPAAVLADLGDREAGYFDYYRGRPIKSDLSGDSFDPRLFDRDAGDGAAAAAIERLRSSIRAAS